MKEQMKLKPCHFGAWCKAFYSQKKKKKKGGIRLLPVTETKGATRIESDLG